MHNMHFVDRSQVWDAMQIHCIDFHHAMQCNYNAPQCSDHGSVSLISQISFLDTVLIVIMMWIYLSAIFITLLSQGPIS